MKAAKEKMFWARLVAVSLLFCTPTIALGLDVLTPQTRAELSTENGQFSVEPSTFCPANQAENYDSSPELASESPVAPKAGDFGLKGIVGKANMTTGQAGRYFGWGRGSSLTKNASNFTKDQLVKDGFTKEILEEMAGA